MRKALVVVVALALLVPALLTTRPASAANELQISVRPGYDGMVRQGTWIPVEVDLANPGASISGQVQISIRRSQVNSTTMVAPVDYWVPVVVPEHSSKRFSTAVYVPPGFDQLQVALKSGTQNLPSATVTLQTINGSQVVCGVLASDPTAFDSLNGLAVGDGRRQPHVVYLDLPDIPTNPQLLSSLDCLILSDDATRGLTQLQQSALSSWVDSGGVLTIGTGPNGASTVAGLPPDLLPASVAGTVSLPSLASLADYFGAASDPSGPWLIANLKLGSGAVVVSDESQPLLVVSRHGKGTVFMLALSLTQKPLRGWDGLDRFWGYVFSYVPVTTPVFSQYYRQDFGWGRTPREALTRGGGEAGPEAQTLLLGLVAFGVVVGPLNYLVLSRLRRRELALATIPLLTAGTTALALTYAVNHRQGDVVVNQVSLVRTYDGSGIGQVRSFVGVFALHPQPYRLSVPENALLTTPAFPLGTRTINNQSPASAFLHVLASGAPEVSGPDLEPGSLSTFVLDGQVHDPGKIRANLSLEGDQLTGQVVNEFSIPIRDAAIVVGDQVQRLGDLRPGAGHTVSIRLTPGSPVGFRDPGQLVDRLLPGRSHDPAARHDVRYDVVSAALNPGQSYVAPIDLGPVGLIGWLDESLGAVKDPNTHQAARQQTLFVTNLSFQVPNRLQTIPEQLVDRQLFSSSYSARIDASGISINAGDIAAFQFTTPVDPARFAVRSLTLVTAAEGAIPGTLEAFNWRTQTWETIPFSLGTLSLPTPERYFSATGTVRLRFHYRPPNPGGAATANFTRFQLQVGGIGR